MTSDPARTETTIIPGVRTNTDPFDTLTIEVTPGDDLTELWITGVPNADVGTASAMLTNDQRRALLAALGGEDWRAVTRLMEAARELAERITVYGVNWDTIHDLRDALAALAWVRGDGETEGTG